MEELKNKRKKNKEKVIIEEDNFSELNDNNYKIKNSNLLNNIKKDYHKLKKYQVYFYLKLNKDSFIFQIQSDFLNVNVQHVYDLIKNIVHKINEKKIIINFNNNNYIVSLKDVEDEDDDNINFYIKNYELRPCQKKNFMPKNDCPIFSSSSLLKNIENENISFICKNSLNIMLREKYETYEEESKQNSNNTTLVI